MMILNFQIAGALTRGLNVYLRKWYQGMLEAGRGRTTGKDFEDFESVRKVVSYCVAMINGIDCGVDAVLLKFSDHGYNGRVEYDNAETFFVNKNRFCWARNQYDGYMCDPRSAGPGYSHVRMYQYKNGRYYSGVPDYEKVDGEYLPVFMKGTEHEDSSMLGIGNIDIVGDIECVEWKNGSVKSVSAHPFQLKEAEDSYLPF